MLKAIFLKEHVKDHSVLQTRGQAKLEQYTAITKDLLKLISLNLMESISPVMDVSVMKTVTIGSPDVLMM